MGVPAVADRLPEGLARGKGAGGVEDPLEPATGEHGDVVYRDRGDQYVTQAFDLTDDVDEVYGKLMKFQAQGGGDTPESVNQALHEAVTKIGWDKSKKVLKLVFLVGDAPPHMDYQDDVKYPAVCKQAVKKDLIINTVQCGGMASTTPIWKEIAKLAEGDYVAIAQTGGVAAISTPVDAEIAKLNRELGVTVVAYGDARGRATVARKLALAADADDEVAADRLSALGRLARLGERPQWISHEGSVDEAQNYLADHAPAAQLTFAPFPYRKHTDDWVLCHLPIRAQARAWLTKVCPPNEPEKDD